MCFISAASCPTLTVTNSGTSGTSGATTDVVVVTCDDGYISDDGTNFSASCDGTGYGTADWSNELACDGV